MKEEKKTKSQLIEEAAALRKRLAALEKTERAKASRPSRVPREQRLVDLERKLEELKPSDHLCLIYESPEEWHAAIIPFLTSGIRKGEKCIYIASTHTSRDIRSYLNKAGVDAKDVEASGQLLVLHKTDAITQEGFFDPEQMISLLIAESEKAIAEGYPNLRLSEETGVQVQGYLGLERLLEYEAKLNRDFFSRYPCTAICQYDRWKSNPAMIKNAIMTHPLIVRNNQVHQNFYYVSPEEFLLQKREEREVQDWLSSIEQESEAEKRVRFLSDVLERSSQPFTVSYSDGYIMFCNPAFSALTGYTEEELHAMTWGLHLTPPRWRESEEKVFEKLNRMREPQRYEKEILRKDGTPVPVEVFIHQISHPRGEIQYYYTFVTDVSERKRAEEAYHAVVDNSLQGILILQDSHIVFANSVMAEMLECSVEELLSFSPKEMNARLHPEDRDRVWELQRDRLEGRSAPSRYEFRILRKDGTVRWLEVFTSVVKYRGKPATQSALIDVTARKQAGEEMVRAREHLEKVFNTVTDSIFVTNSKREFVACNDATERIFGYKRAEMIGKSAVLFYPDRQSFERRGRTDHKKIKEEGYRAGKVTLKRKNGTKFRADFTASLLTDANGKPSGLVVVIRDISKKKSGKR